MPLFRRALLALALSACLMLIIGQFTNVDLIIEDYYYDEALRIFPWKDTWFAKDFMHGSVKNVIIKSGYLLILVVLLDFLFPFKKINPFVRLRLRFVAMASLLVPFVIRGIKQFSVLHCPWSIDRYGGNAPFLRLLDSVPTGLDMGHCFPAGHATVGLWLAAVCVFWLPGKPKIAVAVFFAGLGVGLILGWVQQMRGAHFLFHTLWAGWFASLVILVMLMGFAKKLLHEDQ
jgi:membrane-associated PAP2 superfamily phosphatase